MTTTDLRARITSPRLPAWTTKYLLLIGVIVLWWFIPWWGVGTVAVAALGLHISWWMRRRQRALRATPDMSCLTVRELAAEWIEHQRNTLTVATRRSESKPTRTGPRFPGVRNRVGHGATAAGPVLRRVDTGVTSLVGRRTVTGASSLTTVILILAAIGVATRMPLWGALVVLTLIVGIIAAPVLRLRARVGFAHLIRASRTGSTALFTAAATTMGYLVTMTAPAVIVPVAIAGAALAVGGGGRPTKKPWWTHRVLVAHLTNAGVLAARKAGDPVPVLRYHGQPRVDDTGTTVTVSLPGGRSYGDVVRGQERLAASIGVPTSRLMLTQDPDDAAGTVHILVLNATAAGATRAAIGGSDRTAWADPVTIGRDPLGKPITLTMFEANTLIGGTPGSGKTSLARLVLGHYLLDPVTTIYLIDGKGSRKDYGDARRLCTAFVSGVDEDAAEETLAVFEDVLTLVRSRNADSVADGDDDGVLLLLEEYQDIRASADKQIRERLDIVLGRVIRMGRAVGVHILISTQRPSVDDVPSGVRNLITERVALMLRNGADAQLVLGTTPKVALPTRRGQAILVTPAAEVAATLDHMPDDDWKALCARAATLRATPRTQPAPLAATHDPLEDAVTRILTGTPGMTATAIHAALPADVRPASVVALGKRLSTLSTVTRTRVGKSPAWALTAGASAHARPESSAAPFERETPLAEGSEPVAAKGADTQSEGPAKVPATGGWAVPAAAGGWRV